jgi:hypothetical protein
VKLVLYGNGEVPYCSEVHYKRSLEALGHECELLQENQIPTDVVLAKALRADALIWVHTHGFKNVGMPMEQVLDTLKTAGIPSIAMHLDLYVPIKRWQQYEGSPYFKTEYWFTVDPKLADILNERGDSKAFFIPAGVLEDECYISDQPSPHANDVVFVGSVTNYHPEHRWRKDLVAWLRQTYGSRFTHVGGDGDTGTLRGDDLNRMYANSKVAVGDTLSVNFDYPLYHSDRLWECAGRGGFNLFPRIEGLERWFIDRQNIVFYDFGDFDGLKERIDYYLANDAEREAIRVAGHEHVKAWHTYRHRWSHILETVFGSYGYEPVAA